MAIETYISIITLNVNGCNAPTKRHRLAEWIQKQDPYILLSTRNPLQTSRHILIKLRKTKLKEKILKVAREKQQVTYKGNPICLTADLSAGTL